MGTAWGSDRGRGHVRSVWQTVNGGAEGALIRMTDGAASGGVGFGHDRECHLPRSLRGAGGAATGRQMSRWSPRNRHSRFADGRGAVPS